MGGHEVKRFADWEARLGAYLEANAGVAFAYGAHDCALFSAGAVEAMTGVDLAAEFRGAYDSEFGAARVLASKGEGTLEATIDGLLSARPIGYARRGDLVWNGESVGICIGGDALFAGESEGVAGLVTVPRAAWQKAWRVG